MIKPVLLFGLSLLIRLGVITFTQFDGLYGQDAYAYFEYARILHGTPTGEPLAGEFYWPLGFPALAAVFFSVFGTNAFAAQLASALTGAALAPLTYHLTQLAAPTLRRAPTLAAVLTLACGQLQHSSMSIMSDAAGLCWATLSVVALLRWGKAWQARWIVVAGASAAAAIITRWIFAALLLPLVIGALLLPLRSATPPGRRQLTWCYTTAAAVFAGVVVPQLIFSQSSSSPVLAHGWVANWNLGHALTVSFANPDGHFHYALPPALFYLAPLGHPYYLAPFVSPFVLYGAWVMRRALAGFVLLAWAGAVYFYLIGLPYENFRFGLAYFPPLATLAAVGIETFAIRRDIPRAAVTAVLIAALLSGVLAMGGGLRPLLGTKAREQGALRLLQANAPGGSVVITFSLTQTVRHFTSYETHDLYETSGDVLSAVLCDASGGPIFLIVEPDNIEAQWRGLAPDVYLNWLRANAALEKVGAFESWALFKVSRASCLSLHRHPLLV